jgi:hypothetical protein
VVQFVLALETLAERGPGIQVYHRLGDVEEESQAAGSVVSHEVVGDESCGDVSALLPICTGSHSQAQDSEALPQRNYDGQTWRKAENK